MMIKRSIVDRVISLILVITILLMSVSCSNTPPTPTISDANPQTVTENIEVENIITENILHEFITTEVYLQEFVIAEDKITELLLEEDMINEVTISNSSEAHSDSYMSYSEVNKLIDEWLPRRGDNSRIFDAKSHPGKFSGGEQRLLQVFSVIATRSDTDLLIIDEPLNNLDFVNARYISNLLNKVIKENAQMGVLMISHCRIFPFITRELILTSDGISEIHQPYTCHSCFGEPYINGFYR